MNDLVERLRSMEDKFPRASTTQLLLREAAAELERLRAPGNEDPDDIKAEYGWDEVGYVDGHFEADGTIEAVDGLAREVSRLRAACRNTVPEGWSPTLAEKRVGDNILSVYLSTHVCEETGEELGQHWFCLLQTSAGEQLWSEDIHRDDAPTIHDAIAAAEAAGGGDSDG